VDPQQRGAAGLRRHRRTPEAAREYLLNIVGDDVREERIDAYLDNGPAMLSFVLANSPR